MIANKKSKIYTRRFQTPLKRRRQGKTDYARRRKMVRTDHSSYGVVKSRFVVRITNKKIICQVVKAYLNGDKTIVQANSTELKQFGINFGLTNYSAAYATGLLCARKLIHNLGLENAQDCNENIGEYMSNDGSDTKEAYKCVLDIGLAAATKGARVFSAMKGLSDGGIFIPHSPAKFVGYDSAESELKSDVLRDRLFGKSLSEYMISLRENESDKFEKLFGGYISKGVAPESIQEKYSNCFELIRKYVPLEKAKCKDYTYKGNLLQRKTKEDRDIDSKTKLTEMETVK